MARGRWRARSPSPQRSRSTSGCRGYPGGRGARVRTRLGAGPIVVHRDTGIIYDRLLTQHCLALPRADIPAQDGLFAGYGSDGLALAEPGSPTALVTVATRYTHTAFETVHPDDLTATVDLLRALLTTALPARP